jgi:hypothetical protein
MTKSLLLTRTRPAALYLYSQFYAGNALPVTGSTGYGAPTDFRVGYSGGWLYGSAYPGMNYNLAYIQGPSLGGRFAGESGFLGENIAHDTGGPGARASMATRMGTTSP